MVVGTIGEGGYDFGLSHSHWSYSPLVIDRGDCFIERAPLSLAVFGASWPYLPLELIGLLP